MNLIEIIKNNIIDYDKLREESIIDNINDDKYFINIIVGFRGRTEFVLPLAESLEGSIKYYHNSGGDKNICITFVEHDDEPNHVGILRNRVNYIHSKGNVSEYYNRSFAYNFGVKYSNESEYYILHDLDILVKPNYINQIIENLNRGNINCMQSYGNRHVWYMSENLTKKFLDKNINISDIDRNNNQITPPVLIYSKGGSILVSRESFNKVGGFDPELFWGYSAEDQMFWSKMETLYPIYYADEPTIDIFHMWHPPTDGSNPHKPTMDSYFLYYRSLNETDRLNFLLEKNSLYETNS